MEFGKVNLLYKSKGKLPNKSGLRNNFNSFYNNTTASNVVMGLIIFEML